MRNRVVQTIALFVLLLAVEGYADAEGSAFGYVEDVVVVVSPGNPVTEMTRNQVRDIFLGRSTRFPDGRRAVPVDQPDGSAVRIAFDVQVLDRSEAQVRAHWAKVIFTGRGRPPREVADADEVKQVVGPDPHAIGYMSRSRLDDSVAVVALR